MSVKLVEKKTKKTSYQKGGDIDTVGVKTKGPSSNDLRSKFGDFSSNPTERKAISDATQREEDEAAKTAGGPGALKAQREEKIKSAMAEAKANRDKQDAEDKAARTPAPKKLLVRK